MTLVRYTADGGHYRVGGHGFDPGQEKDVDDDLAEYLAGRDDFEVVDDGGGSAGQEDEPPDDEPDTDDVGICGVEMSDGDECERPADECPYHGDDEED